jgi:WXG100 family type VII secretion target
MSQVNVDAEQVRQFSDSIRMYANSTSQIMMKMRSVYDRLDDEWDDDSKDEYIESFRRTCDVLSNVNEALRDTNYSLTEIASIIEQYANV